MERFQRPTVISLAVDGQVIGLIAIQDNQRPAQKEAIKSSREARGKIVMCTEDNEQVAQAEVTGQVECALRVYQEKGAIKSFAKVGSARRERWDISSIFFGDVKVPWDLVRMARQGHGSMVTSTQNDFAYQCMPLI